MNKLLNPKVFVKQINNVSYMHMKKLLAMRKQRKYGFKDIAYEVVELENGLYNVHMEYIV